jgi:autoinducer 2-degrading protein
MLTVTAKVWIQPGKSEEFIAAYRLMKPQVMQDPGAILYALNRSLEDPNQFIFCEQYESEEAFAYHLSTEHFKILAGTIDPLMSAPGEIGKWVEVV